MHACGQKAALLATRRAPCPSPCIPGSQGTGIPLMSLRQKEVSMPLQLSVVQSMEDMEPLALDALPLAAALPLQLAMASMLLWR